MMEVTNDKSLNLPSTKIWLRATVAAIPYVGGALDHLLFDRADEIRLANIEQWLTTLQERLKTIGESAIDTEWFESTEALAMFRNMTDKIQFEPDPKKVTALAKLVATSGTKQFSKDSRKLSVLNHISSLSFVQMKLLTILDKMTPQTKQFLGGAIRHTVTGLWSSDILQMVQQNPDGQFWEGEMQLNLELEILCSTNTVSRVPALVASADSSYMLTPLGKLAAAYLNKSDL